MFLSELMVCKLLFLGFVMVMAPDPIPPEEEIKALIDFFDNFGGPYWYQKENWKDENTLCGNPGWFGVSCAADSISTLHIHSLGLTANNLTGKFDSFQSWNKWPYIVSLFADQNQLSGTIPEVFWNTITFQQIHLTGNKIGGSISSSLKNLQDLAELQLDYNKLDGSIPAELFELPKLTRVLLGANTFTGSLIINANASSYSPLVTLDLGQNLLGGPVPSAIYTFTNLNLLVLSGVTNVNKLNGFTGSISKDLVKLINLENLILSNNKFTGTVPTEITQLKNLKQLFLDNNKLSGTIPVNIDNLNGLAQLSLNQNDFFGNIPTGLFKCQNLAFLDFGLNKFNGTIPTLISNLQSLQTLILKGRPPPFNQKNSKLSGAVPAQLWTLRNLKFLYLSFNELEGSIADSIGDDMQSLQTMSLESNKLNGSIPTSFYSLANLQFLYIYQNKFTGKLTNGLAKIPLTNFDAHTNAFQGHCPSYFDVSHNLTQPTNTLAGNSFLCPVSEGARRIFGVVCKNVQINVIRDPKIIFKEISNTVVLTGNNFPDSLISDLSCLMGSSPGKDVGTVVLIDNNQVQCRFGPTLLDGYQTVSIYLDGVSIASKDGLLTYGRPFVHGVFPNIWREQGDEDGERNQITVVGTGFVQTGEVYCRYNNTLRPATYVNSTVILCPIPKYPFLPIVYNVSVQFSVSNDNFYYSNTSFLFHYYPWCYGEPPCGGSKKGTCIPTPPGERPYCHCNTPGFNNLTFCDSCLDNHYGSECTPCRDCYNGTCNAGYDNDGSCKCNLFYMGENCLFFWGLYAGASAGGFIVLFSVFFFVKYRCSKFRKAQKPEEIRSLVQ